MPPTAVLLDHDGSVDDLVALILALISPQIELEGVAVTDGDCYLQPAFDATLAICASLGKQDMPAWASTARAKNPFPSHWREASWQVSNLPVLRRQHPVSQRSHPSMADQLRANPATIVSTGPLTNLHLLQRSDPDAFRSIEHIMWMGGAFDVPGNVIEIGRNTAAEWNVYWDAEAATAILNSGVPMTIIPLDATCNVPITGTFLDQINETDTAVADLVAQLYGTVRHRYYEAWDMLTVAALCWPELFEFESKGVRVCGSGPNEGQTTYSTDGPIHQLATGVNGAAVLEQFLAALQ